MERDTGKPIYCDALRQDLDRARDRHRRSYDRGYLLSQKGQDEEAQRILDAANAAWERAKASYLAARAANPVPEWAKEGAL
jgi:hypothetical protein